MPRPPPAPVTMTVWPLNESCGMAGVYRVIGRGMRSWGETQPRTMRGLYRPYPHVILRFRTSVSRPRETRWRQGKLVIARVGPAVGGPRSGPGCQEPAKMRQPRVRVVGSNSKRPYLVFRRARYRRPNSPRRWGPIGDQFSPPPWNGGAATGSY